MNAKEKETLKSLLVKLSAVRITLSDEEQVLLDRLILGTPVEVQAHGFVRGAEGAVIRDADEVAAHGLLRGAEGAVVRDADEVAAHGLLRGAEGAVIRDADEVAAHGLLRDAEGAVVRAPSAIFFDPESEAYQLVS